MDGRSVRIARVRFDEYEAEIEALLGAYHRWVAAGFDESLSRRDGDHDFSPAAYVQRELEKDLAYLDEHARARPIVVAVHDGHAVGCVYLYALPDRTGEVKRLFVREAFRGLDLGHRLMSTLIEHARATGYATLRLDTAAFMDSARRLYEDVGFEPYDGGSSISDIPEPVLEDITYMQLALNDER